MRFALAPRSLTPTREKVLDAVGDITLNLSAGLNRISSFGTLFDWSAGLTWSPSPSSAWRSVAASRSRTRKSTTASG